MISKMKGWQHVREVFRLLSASFSSCFREDNDVSVQELYTGIKKTMTAVYKTCTGVSRRLGGQCIRMVKGIKTSSLHTHGCLSSLRKTLLLAFPKKDKKKKNFLKTSMRARSLKTEWLGKQARRAQLFREVSLACYYPKYIWIYKYFKYI